MFNDPHLCTSDVNFQNLTPLSFLDIALERYAQKPSVAWRDHQWNYAEFGGIVSRMIDWLKHSGIGAGDVVSVILSNRPELLAAHYAIPALGAILNTINIRLDSAEVGYILSHSGSKLLIGEKFTTADLDITSVPVVMLCESPEQVDGLNFYTGPIHDLVLTEPVIDESQPIALNYTSGTTGKPKGVVYNHRGAYLNALGNVLLLGLTDESRYLWTLPMFHCNGWTHTWAVTAAGGLHVCLDRVEAKLIFSTIDTHRVSHMCCAPVVLYMLANEASQPLKHSVKVGTGGASPTPELLTNLEQLGFSLMHLYGLTESYGPATANIPVEKSLETPEQRAQKLARQGFRHITGVTINVIDEHGQEVPSDGVTMGEIVLRGNTLMSGYFRDPEATKKAFDGGFYHTGDLAVRYSNGEIEIRDRSKDIIISGGENFSSLEVEKILHQHPDIFLAAVVAAPHSKWGETACAFIEPKPNRQLDKASIDAFCQQRLAGFKRPRLFIFGELPLTATGKVKKFLLRDKAREVVESGKLGNY